jgi:hypothetical protein
MEDWPEDEGSPRRPPRPTLRPVFVAVLIVVACVALAVYTLRNPYAPPPPPEPEATASPTPASVRKAPATAAPTRPPATWAVPTLPPATTAPTAVATATAAATRPPAATAPPTAIPATAAPTAPSEPPSLRNVAPPRVKKGSTTLIDVRGKGLRADLRAIILRGGKVPPEIAVPRQRFVDGTLLQVLIVVAPGAPKGEYDLSVADVEGRRSNSVKFEVIQ